MNRTLIGNKANVIEERKQIERVTNTEIVKTEQKWFDYYTNPEHRFDLYDYVHSGW